MRSKTPRIFVFGSNTQGRHGAGAAYHAKQTFGAIYGQARGLQGESYAIVTKELRPDYPPVILGEIRKEVKQFLQFAKSKPDFLFYVTAIGCGLAGFKVEQIAPMFCPHSSNILLHQKFILYLAGLKISEQPEE